MVVPTAVCLRLGSHHWWFGRDEQRAVLFVHAGAQAPAFIRKLLAFCFGKEAMADECVRHHAMDSQSAGRGRRCRKSSQPFRTSRSCVPFLRWGDRADLQTRGFNALQSGGAVSQALQARAKKRLLRWWARSDWSVSWLSFYPFDHVRRNIWILDQM